MAFGGQFLGGWNLRQFRPQSNGFRMLSFTLLTLYLAIMAFSLETRPRPNQSINFPTFGTQAWVPLETAFINFSISPSV